MSPNAQIGRRGDDRVIPSSLQLRSEGSGTAIEPVRMTDAERFHAQLIKLAVIAEELASRTCAQLAPISRVTSLASAKAPGDIMVPYFNKLCEQLERIDAALDDIQDALERVEI